MSDRNFSRRRRGGMRFRPSGGFNQNQKPDRSAQQARAEATGEKKPDSVFERARHEQEIERAENIAAGLPPEGAAAPPEAAGAAGAGAATSGAFRKPHLDTPAEVQEEKFEPVPLEAAAARAWSTASSRAANKVIRKVQRSSSRRTRPTRKSSSTPNPSKPASPCWRTGRLEEFTIERTTEERLVGSIFKGKVRNLEDGLKAAFVDIGFEKNAFLHYWDIVPTSFDSGVEVVERAKTNGATARASRRRTSRAFTRPAAKSSCR